MAHISASDAMKYPFSVSGAQADVRGTVTGMAFITSAGQQQPVVACNGFASVKFEDKRDKKKVTVSKFAADEVRESDIADDPAKRR
jgi:glutamate racemase